MFYRVEVFEGGLVGRALGRGGRLDDRGSRSLYFGMPTGLQSGRTLNVGASRGLWLLAPPAPLR